MADRKPDPRESFDALMQGAGLQRRKAAQRSLQAERKLARTRREGGIEGLLARLELEIASLESVLEFTACPEERVFLKAEIAFLRKALEAKRSGRRWPPESGVPVPAIPPNGPLPKQGGAAAPLEFDS